MFTISKLDKNCYTEKDGGFNPAHYGYQRLVYLNRGRTIKHSFLALKDIRKEFSLFPLKCDAQQTRAILKQLEKDKLIKLKRWGCVIV